MRLLLRAAAALLLAGVGPVHGTILPAVVSVTGYVVSGCAQAGVPCRGAQQTGVFLSDQYTTQSSFAYTTSLEQELLTTVGAAHLTRRSERTTLTLRHRTSNASAPAAWT